MFSDIPAPYLVFIPLLLLLAGGMLALWRRQHRLAQRIKAIGDSEATYRALVQEAACGIFRSNEYRLLFVNPALVRMLGYGSEAELLALNPVSRLYADPAGRERVLEQLRVHGYARSMELLLKRKDGSQVRVRINGSTVRDDKGNAAFEGIVEDITARHVLEAQLRHSEKLTALGRLVAGAAHEINNPLTAILGYAELLAGNAAISAEHRGYLERIQQQARRTKAITSSLQHFSSQTVEQKRQPLDLNNIIANAVRIEDLSFGAHQVSFRQELDPSLPRILGDEYQLLEVCMHVLNNSVDALKSCGGGTVTVRTSLDNGSVVMEMRDTGPGIEDVSRVFDPFYTTKPVGNGAGLGLSACYGIIKEHGGEIQCVNRPEGGAAVIIRLPAAQV